MWELVLAREKEVGGSEALIEGGGKVPYSDAQAQRDTQASITLFGLFSLVSWVEFIVCLRVRPSASYDSCGNISYILVAGLLGSLTLLFSVGTVKLLAAHTGRVEVQQVFLSCKPPRT